VLGSQDTLLKKNRGRGKVLRPYTSRLYRIVKTENGKTLEWENNKGNLEAISLNECRAFCRQDNASWHIVITFMHSWTADDQTPSPRKSSNLAMSDTSALSGGAYSENDLILKTRNHKIASEWVNIILLDYSSNEEKSVNFWLEFTNFRQYVGKMSPEMHDGHKVTDDVSNNTCPMIDVTVLHSKSTHCKNSSLSTPLGRGASATTFDDPNCTTFLAADKIHSEEASPPSSMRVVGSPSVFAQDPGSANFGECGVESTIMKIVNYFGCKELSLKLEKHFQGQSFCTRVLTQPS
jgi:hypothetical protein